MELIKLLDVANPKLIKDTLNSVLQDYGTFRTEIEEAANAALNTAVTANDTANTALTTVTDYEAIVMESAQDSREAVLTSELAMNVANEAKSTVDQALDIGALGSFVHNVNGIALAHAHMTDDPNQADDEELSFLATPTLVREAVKDKADLTNEDQSIVAGHIKVKSQPVDYPYDYQDSGIHIYGANNPSLTLGLDENDYNMLIGTLESQSFIHGFPKLVITGADEVYISSDGDVTINTDLVAKHSLDFNRLANNAKRIILDMVHPVNSIIQIEDGTFDPNVYYAGTGSVWERLPDGYVLWSASSGAGETINAGLPNITGRTRVAAYTIGNMIFTDTQGALREINTGYYVGKLNTSVSTTHTDTPDTLILDASVSNSIYGNSDTVQPPARKTCMWKRTA